MKYLDIWIVTKKVFCYFGIIMRPRNCVLEENSKFWMFVHITGDHISKSMNDGTAGVCSASFLLAVTFDFT